MFIKLNSWNKIKLSTGQILLIVGLGTLGVATGVTPEYDTISNTIRVNNQAFAQSISDADLIRYAQAAIEIERLRQPTFANLENMVGKDRSSDISCNQENTMNKLPSNARSLVMDYCRTSEGIVKEHGFSINQFNQITQQVRQSSDLRNRLRDITRQL